MTQTFHIYYPGQSYAGILPTSGVITMDLNIEFSLEDILHLKKTYSELLDIPIDCILTQQEHETINHRDVLTVCKFCNENVYHAINNINMCIDCLIKIS